METTERQTLMTVAELLGSAILRIDRITRSLRGEQMDRLEAAGIPEDILKMKEEYATLDDSLQLSVFFINDQWPAIENNRARLGELRSFADGFGRFSLILEVLKFGCKESKLLDISEDSMRGAIALSYYFIACGIKAHRKFLSSPVDELPGM